jgi:anti-sigma regulatory factor (Ser/Thr protein kinase)
VATGTEVLNAGRDGHAVLFYREEQELAERVGEHLLSAVRDGGLAVVIATPDHRRSFERRLAGAGIDVAAALERGSYVALDASEAIRGFMVSGWPDPASFWRVISPLVRQAAKAGQPVRLFGEMVWLLWDAGLVNAAIEVEALWNELGHQYSFSLLCAYPAPPVGTGLRLDALTEVCRLHTEVVGGPPEPVDRERERQLSSPPGDAEVLRYRADLAGVRSFAAARARRAGLPPRRVGDLVIAVSELAANTLAHTSGPGSLALWVTDSEVICQIHDLGEITDPLAGKLRPDPVADGGGRGLWVVHQLCDRVEIGTGSAAPTIRVHMRLSAPDGHYDSTPGLRPAS